MNKSVLIMLFNYFSDSSGMCILSKDLMMRSFQADSFLELSLWRIHILILFLSSQTLCSHGQVCCASLNSHWLYAPLPALIQLAGHRKHLLGLKLLPDLFTLAWPQLFRELTEVQKGWQWVTLLFPQTTEPRNILKTLYSAL